MSEFNKTVQDILDYIYDNRVPRNAKIIYQRIEDSYFNGSDISGLSGNKNSPDGIFPPESKASAWKTIKVKGDCYYQCKEYNENMKKGQLVIEGKLDKDEVGRYFYEDEFKENRKLIDLTDEKLLDQYVDVNTIFYDARNNALCITSHY